MMQVAEVTLTLSRNNRIQCMVYRTKHVTRDVRVFLSRPRNFFIHQLLWITRGFFGHIVTRNSKGFWSKCRQCWILEVVQTATGQSWTKSNQINCIHLNPQSFHTLWTLSSCRTTSLNRATPSPPSPINPSFV